MAAKIAGKIPFFLERVNKQLAAMDGILLSNLRLSQKKLHNSHGIVKVICCQDVFGRIWFCLSIQISVAFLPQEEHALDLQVKVTYFTCGQFGFEQWYSR